MREWCIYLYLLLHSLIAFHCRPVILAQKARHLRHDTGEERWWAPLEKQGLSFSQRVQRILGTPFKMLFQEPMLFAINLYMSVSNHLRHID